MLKSKKQLLIQQRRVLREKRSNGHRLHPFHPARQTHQLLFISVSGTFPFVPCLNICHRTALGQELKSYYHYISEDLGNNTFL